MLSYKLLLLWRIPGWLTYSFGIIIKTQFYKKVINQLSSSEIYDFKLSIIKELFVQLNILKIIIILVIYMEEITEQVYDQYEKPL